MNTVTDWSVGLTANWTSRVAVPPHAVQVCISPLNVPWSKDSDPRVVAHTGISQILKKR